VMNKYLRKNTRTCDNNVGHKSDILKSLVATYHPLSVVENRIGVQKVKLYLLDCSRHLNLVTSANSTLEDVQIVCKSFLKRENDVFFSKKRMKKNPD
jgi:hypothetical protein